MRAQLKCARTKRLKPIPRGKNVLGAQLLSKVKQPQGFPPQPDGNDPKHVTLKNDN